MFSDFLLAMFSDFILLLLQEVVMFFNIFSEIKRNREFYGPNFSTVIFLVTML